MGWFNHQLEDEWWAKKVGEGFPGTNQNGEALKHLLGLMALKDSKLILLGPTVVQSYSLPRRGAKLRAYENPLKTHWFP